MKKLNGPPNEVAVLITDIHQYSRITANMTADQIRDLMIGYYEGLQTIILRHENQAEGEMQLRNSPKAIYLAKWHIFHLKNSEVQQLSQ